MSKLPIKRVLHIAHGLSSYNNSLVELVNGLQAADVEVVVASHIELSEVLRDQRVTFTHLTRDRELKAQCDADIKACTHGSRLHRIWQKLKLARRYRRMSLENAEISTLIKISVADILLIDMECHFAILTALSVARKTDCHIVLCSRWFSVFRTKNLPPMHTALQPAQLCERFSWNNWRNKAAIDIAWARLWYRKSVSTLRYSLSIRRLLPVVYQSISRVDLQALCRTLGLNVKQHTSTRHWLMPHVYTSLPVMSLNAEALEFPQANDARMHYVGAMVGASNYSSARFYSALTKFNEFAAQPGFHNKHLIYCSFSTFWTTDVKRINPLLDVFRRRPDLNLVMGLGGQSKPEGLGTLPGNILVLEYAPQIDILSHASVVISHGGISTINEALFHGVPLLLYSSGHVDQDGCMARVVYHKVGLSVSSEPILPEELERLLDRLLNASSEDPIQQNVKRLQARLQDYKRDNAALEMLKSVVDS